MRKLNRIMLGVCALICSTFAGCKEQPKANLEAAEEIQKEQSAKTETNLKKEADDDENDENDNDEKDDDEEEETLAATCSLNPTKNNKADGIQIVADLDGLSPGSHGFHIHEKGDCSGDDASLAGGHFNPTNAKHGGPDSAERHVGDLGNVIADKNGHAHYERLDKIISLKGPNSIIGRSVVIHSKEDDYKTQPAGNSGERIACGVIKIFSVD
jgi:Cu-Zn family superoxide dismutase